MKKIELRFENRQETAEPPSGAESACVSDASSAVASNAAGDAAHESNAGKKPFKLRWGIIGGACAIAVFYLTIGFIAAWVVLNQIAAQTSHTASPFGTWWQVAIFIADIAFALGAIGAYVMVVLNGIRKRREHVTQ